MSLLRKKLQASFAHDFTLLCHLFCCPIFLMTNQTPALLVQRSVNASCSDVITVPPFFSPPALDMISNVRPLGHLKIKMAAINCKTRYITTQPPSHEKTGDCEQSISLSIPWARLRVSLIVACGIAAGRVEIEAALEEVLEDRSLDASLSNSLTLPFIPSSTLSTADKNGSRGYYMWPCHLTWASEPDRARARKIKWNLLSQFKYNLQYIGKFKRNLLTFQFKGLS